MDQADFFTNHIFLTFIGKTVLMRVNSAKGVEDPNKLNFPILRVAQLALGMGVDGASVSAEEIVADGDKKHSAQSEYGNYQVITFIALLLKGRSFGTMSLYMIYSPSLALFCLESSIYSYSYARLCN